MCSTLQMAGSPLKEYPADILCLLSPSYSSFLSLSPQIWGLPCIPEIHRAAFS